MQETSKQETSKPRSWQEMREWQIGLLERDTGEPLGALTERIRRQAPATDQELRAWPSCST
ncbi:hypothetical protein ABZU86_30685 [Streptomyces sp. NPDC005271]|uniref:hypothetical protein n=1 Tax=unclassified Streptomyces TaxID=2593676 RepID=UPI00339F4A4F